MKNIISCFIMLSVISCNTTPVKETLEMQGAYLMTSQTLNDGNRDTKYTTLKQLKMYTDSFMMYTQVNSADSISAFGVGSYTTDTGTVIENVLFRAKDTSINPPANYKLNITKGQDGYVQMIPAIIIDSKKYKLTELYQTVGTTAKTPLDGVWKETRSYTVRGNDSAKNNRTQYKAYYAGHFMWGHAAKDSMEKTRTGIGFGTFQMINDTTMKETDLNSTYKIIAGESFTVGIQMTGADNYRQTINNADGSKGVEYYERLK